MSEMKQELEETILQALSHEVRREIVRIIDSSEGGVSYTELMGELELPTAKLNYHINQLEGLVERNEDRKYVLTPLGELGAKLLSSITTDVRPGVERYVKAAQAAQRSVLHPLLRSLIYGLMFSVSVIIVGTSVIAYVIVTEGGPPLMYVLLPLILLMEVGFLAWLLYALRSAPDFLKRFERRISSD